LKEQEGLENGEGQKPNKNSVSSPYSLLSEAKKLVLFLAGKK